MHVKIKTEICKKIGKGLSQPKQAFDTSLFEPYVKTLFAFIALYK